MTPPLTLSSETAARLLIRAAQRAGTLTVLGGKGSGHHGHAGRKGQVGGSAPGTTVWHGTVASQLASIKKEGLTIEHAGEVWPGFSQHGQVYVTSDFTRAKDWAISAASQADRATFTPEGALMLPSPAVMPVPTVLKIHIPADAVANLGPDTHFADVPGSHNLQFSGSIKPEWIVGAWTKSLKSIENTSVYGTTDEEELALWKRALAERGVTFYVALVLSPLRTLGGPGSGNFGHRGRPGQVGGSAPGGLEIGKTQAVANAVMEIVAELTAAVPTPEMSYTDDAEFMLRARDTEMAIVYDGEIPKATYTMNNAGAVFLPKPSSPEGRALRGTTIVHNHPVPAGLPPETDLSFSVADLKTAVSHNLQEIKAVTPNGVFSLKRLGASWPTGVTQYAATRWKSSIAKSNDVASFFDRVWQKGVASRFAKDVRYAFTPARST